MKLNDLHCVLAAFAVGVESAEQSCAISMPISKAILLLMISPFEVAILGDD